VTFTDGGANVGTAAPGTGTFSITTSGLGEGSHTITATFNPTDPAAFGSSSSTAPAFALTAPQYAPAEQNLQADIPPGTLVISTPYTPSNPLNLGTLALNPAATQYSASAAFSGITVTDTRAGDLAWTVSALASPLTSSAGSVSAQNVGLTGIVADPVSGNALTAGSVVATSNPAASPAVAPSAPGAAGLGGGSPHRVLHADHGEGSIGFHGLVTLNAPSSAGPGTYLGTITFTIG
jgi:hypothetical protein